MLATDENALICDLAETYRILDYEALPPTLVATLSAGLRDDSRIKMRLAGMRVSTDTLLLANIADAAHTLVWQKTKDGMKGRNKPRSILQTLLGESEDREPVQAFETPEDFEAARAAILKEVGTDG